MSLQTTLAQLAAHGNEKVRAQHQKQGAGDKVLGMRLGDICKMAAKNHFILAATALLVGSVPAVAEEFIHRYESGKMCYVVVTQTWGNNSSTKTYTCKEYDNRSYSAPVLRAKPQLSAREKKIEEFKDRTIWQPLAILNTKIYYHTEPEVLLTALEIFTQRMPAVRHKEINISQVNEVLQEMKPYTPTGTFGTVIEELVKMRYDMGELKDWKYQPIPHCKQNAYLFTARLFMQGVEVMPIGFVFDSPKLLLNEDLQAMLNTKEIPCRQVPQPLKF